jgi:hypothetical protein
MKLFKNWIIVPTTLAAILTTITLVSADPLPITPNFKPDPIVLSGISGGAKDSQGCGKIGEEPNHVIHLSDDFKYLRFSVEGEGDLTLLIEPPSGSPSCVLYDSTSGGKIQSSGLWERGTYRIFIGDRSGKDHNYTLSITQVR